MRCRSPAALAKGGLVKTASGSSTTEGPLASSFSKPMYFRVRKGRLLPRRSASPFK